MVLELWTVKLVPGSEVCSPSTVYYRMSVMLKSTLTISRITPAYKLSRSQHNESYKISHKIYGGEPDYDVLGKFNIYYDVYSAATVSVVVLADWLK